MSEKKFTVILKVDLHCSACNKKIKSTLCKLQDQEKIQSVVYDEKNNTVTVTGTFDPKKLLTKICCKACKVIKDIQIVEVKPPPPEPKAVPPPPEPKPKPAPPEPEPEPEPEPQKVEPVPPPPEPVVKRPEPAPGSGGCCCRPWFVPYYGGCRCCSCGWICGPVSNCPPTCEHVCNCPPPPPRPLPLPLPLPLPPTCERGCGGQCCDGPRTCEFICEEQPATCRIM